LQFLILLYNVIDSFVRVKVVLETSCFRIF